MHDSVLVGATLFCVKMGSWKRPLTSVAFGLEKLEAKEAQMGARCSEPLRLDTLGRDFEELLLSQENNEIPCLPEPERIKGVAMDMHEPFHQAVEMCLPRVKVVVDKFHLIRHINGALDKRGSGYREEVEEVRDEIYLRVGTFCSSGLRGLLPGKRQG